jgi:Redoxin
MHRRIPWVAPFLILLWAHAALGQASHVLDLDGREVDLFAGSPAATVLVFVRTDCPISNQAAPEIERLRQRFGSKNVRFWLVYVDPDQPASAIRAHLEEFRLGAAAVVDPDHALVARVGARVTPEAAVFLPGTTATMVYRGRLDNRYAGLGRARPRATKHDLEEAIEAALSGTPRALVTTPAVGCEIADLR